MLTHDRRKAPPLVISLKERAIYAKERHNRLEADPEEILTLLQEIDNLRASLDTVRTNMDILRELELDGEVRAFVDVIAAELTDTKG